MLQFERECVIDSVSKEGGDEMRVLHLSTIGGDDSYYISAQLVMHLGHCKDIPIGARLKVVVTVMP